MWWGDKSEFTGEMRFHVPMAVTHGLLWQGSDFARSPRPPLPAFVLPRGFHECVGQLESVVVISQFGPPAKAPSLPCRVCLCSPRASPDGGACKGHAVQREPLGCQCGPPTCTPAACSNIRPFVDVSQAFCALLLLPGSACQSLHTYCVPGDRRSLR